MYKLHADSEKKSAPLLLMDQILRFHEEKILIVFPVDTYDIFLT